MHHLMKLHLNQTLTMPIVLIISQLSSWPYNSLLYLSWQYSIKNHYVADKGALHVDGMYSNQTNKL